MIDLSDSRSGQVDVIIANEDQPFRTSIHEGGLFFLEGVGAAGEVKSALTTSELQVTLDAATLFKRLRRQDRGILFMANTSDQVRFFDCPPYFLFAFEGLVASKTLLERLAAAEPVFAADGSGHIVCSRCRIYTWCRRCYQLWRWQGALRFQYDSGPLDEVATGSVWHSRDAGIFTYFLLWLGAVMPRFLGFPRSPPAISLEQWSLRHDLVHLHVSPIAPEGGIYVQFFRSYSTDCCQYRNSGHAYCLDKYSSYSRS